MISHIIFASTWFTIGFFACAKSKSAFLPSNINPVLYDIVWDFFFSLADPPFVTFLHKKEYWWWQENHARAPTRSILVKVAARKSKPLAASNRVAAGRTHKTSRGKNLPKMEEKSCH